MCGASSLIAKPPFCFHKCFLFIIQVCVFRCFRTSPSTTIPFKPISDSPGLSIDNRALEVFSAPNRDHPITEKAAGRHREVHLYFSPAVFALVNLLSAQRSKEDLRRKSLGSFLLISRFFSFFCLLRLIEASSKVSRTPP